MVEHAEAAVIARDWHDRSLPLPDSDELREALDSANIHTLLMVYVHLTHDAVMLDIFGNYTSRHSRFPGPRYRTNMRRNCGPSCCMS